jgi:hypothetical protein
MSHPYHRLCLLLAGAEFSERDLKQLAEKLSKTDVSELIKDMNLSAKADRPSLRANTKKQASAPLQRPAEQGVEERITTILLSTGMSSTNAAKYLRDSIAERHPNLTLPTFQRKPLAYVLPRLLDLVPTSELLHLAAAVKSRTFSGENIPWPVMSNDEQR